jgi:hypothetical protein
LAIAAGAWTSVTWNVVIWIVEMLRQSGKRKALRERDGLHAPKARLRGRIIFPNEGTVSGNTLNHHA